MNTEITQDGSTEVGGIISLFVLDTIIVSEDIRGFCWGGVFSAGDIVEIVELGQAIRSIRARLVIEGKMSDNIVTKRTL